MNLSMSLSAIALVLASCKKPPARDCPEFTEAEKLLDQISNTTLDPTFADPRYAPALAAFEAIPADCAQHGSAVTIAETIRTAMAKQPAETTAAPPPASPPPAAAPINAAKDDGLAEEVAAYIHAINDVPPAPDGSNGRVYADKLIREAMKDTAKYDEFIALSDKSLSDLQSMSVPEPCAEFHQLQLDLGRRSRKLVEDMHQAIADQDAEKVLATAAAADEMKGDQRKLILMEQELKHRFQVR